MKKVILITTVFMTSLAVNAQSSVQTPKQKSKMYHSFAWGLFQSKNYPKDKIDIFQAKTPEFSYYLQIDTTKYEQRSALWGAIQWTEKKKSSSLVKPQSNGK